MQAAVLRATGGKLTIETASLAAPAAHEVLIRTVAAGVCHSDLHFAKGAIAHPLPVILGHEAAGVVEAVGTAVTALAPGDHVVTCMSVYCGECAECLSGNMARCDAAAVKRSPRRSARICLGGEPLMQFVNLSAFAERMLVHEHACVRIRKDMPLDRAALLGCAVLTGTGAAMRTAGIRAGETVAVIGCGGVGLAAINGAAIAGALRIIAVDRLDVKLALAKRFGATDFVNASDVDAVARVLALTGGGVDHAIEAVGLKFTIEQAFSMLAPGGTATVAGLVPPGIKIEIDGMALLGEKKLQGSMMGSNRFPIDIPQLVAYYMQGRLNLDDMVHRHIHLDGINEAFEELESGCAARSVIMFE
jgi:S-(hydroxymethyl)glutathione dehydrogenase/alcohol dehydrogenase